MFFSIRDYQGRVNGIFNKPLLALDGVSGPKTRDGIKKAMRRKKVQRKQDLFDRGIRGVTWHWSAGAKGFIELEKEAYNFLFSTTGDTIDGNNTPAEQAAYDWKKGIGASHTRSMNTGWLGLSIDAMAGARQSSPVEWGNNPITWAGIDAMLELTMELCAEYDIPVSRWTTLSHAEVQPTLGVRQKHKWDFCVLPGDTSAFQDPVEVGDKLRARMLKKFSQ